MQRGADTSDKDQYEANAGRLAEMSTKNAGDLSDDELNTMLELRSAQKESIGRAREEAIAENAERDAETARKAAEAKVAEEAARAEQAAAHAAKEAEDVARAAALAEQIKSGNIGGEAKPAAMLEAPKTEMFQKYGEKMRLDSSRVAEIMREIRKHDDMKNNQDLDYEDRLQAEKASFALNEKRNQLLDGAFFGTTDTRAFRQELGLRNQKIGEASTEYWDYLSKVLDEYYDAAMQDPVTVMNLAEAGAINGDAHAKSIGEKLRSNPEFMRKLLDVLPQNKTAESFWQYVAGDAQNDRGLYIAAIRKNHLNYQYGPKDWKTDPEVQKIALESGLDSMYLQKN